jgi:DNA methyltransferase 1-associated protein 1
LATSGKQNQPLISHIGSGTTNKMFDVAHERERRHHLDRLWNRSKEEEAEELQLRKELRVIEAQLRKLKKSGGHLLAAASSGVTSSGGITAAAAGSSRLSSAASSRNPSRSASPVNVAENSQILDQSFASTAPVPMPQHPYLQSGRLAPPATGPNGINKSLLSRMDSVLAELHIPQRPLPTKRVCDLYDAVRKDILTLVTLQKLTMQKEGVLQSKRTKLAKLGGASLSADDAALDEERLLGIAPPPPPAPPKPAPAPVPATTTKPKSPKKKGSGKGKGVKKAPATAAEGTEGAKPAPAAAAAPAGATATDGTSGKKKAVKRKRKVEPGKSPNPAPNKKSTGKSSSTVGAGGKAAAPGSGPPDSAGAPAASASSIPPTSSAKKRARKS